MISSSLRRHGALSVVIAGGGLIGLGIAWRLAQRGQSVVVFDRAEPGSGASFAAAGMLSVVGEAESPAGPYFDLCRESRARWPSFARELEAEAGIDLDLRECGTLLVAGTESEKVWLKELVDRYSPHGLLRSTEGAEARSLEPELAPGLLTAFAPIDAQVDNRAVTRALRIAAGRAGADIVGDEEVARILIADGRVTGVQTTRARYAADFVVVAAGVGTSALLSASGLDALTSITPVKGELIALQANPTLPPLRHIIRSSEGIYLVPRSSGRLIVGATSEPGSWSTDTSAAARDTLYRSAISLVPALADLPIVEHWAGLRPRPGSDMPQIGSADIEGLMLAVGHYRNGVLLTPITADLVTGLLTQDLSIREQMLANPFSPGNDDLAQGSCKPDY